MSSMIIFIVKIFMYVIFIYASKLIETLDHNHMRDLLQGNTGYTDNRNAMECMLHLNKCFK